MRKLDSKFSRTETGLKVTFDYELLRMKLNGIFNDEQASRFVQDLKDELLFGLIDDVYEKLDKANQSP